MLKLIDDFLNQITMYRLMLYYLIGLIVISIIFSFFHLVPFSFLSIIFSALYLVFICRFINGIFAKVFRAPTNIESSYITAFILALIIKPADSVNDFIFLAWAAILAMASKYILAIGRKHIFNPAAISVVLTAFFINQSAIWWIASPNMMLFVFFGGLLIVRKIQRKDMVYSFIFITLLMTLIISAIKGNNLALTIRVALFQSSLFFFAFVMLTEPQTTPPTRLSQIIYGLIIGIFYTPQIHFANIYMTPELALTLGNIYSFLVSPKEKLILRLKEKIQTSIDTYDFIFPLKKPLLFAPGQYMEWTLAHKHTDNRGNRRYFTIASSPTENNLRIGVKFYSPSSSFKKALFAMNEYLQIVASQLSGDFVLPKDSHEKLVFIAGGIGITPYRSIIKYLIDKNEKRDIILFFSNKLESEIIYQDIFDEAQKKLGIKTIYTLTDKNQITPNWKSKVGRIDDVMIKKEVPDYQERLFYLSGPHAMVKGFEEVLNQIGINKNQIKIDFFPGYI